MSAIMRCASAESRWIAEHQHFLERVRRQTADAHRAVRQAARFQQRPGGGIGAAQRFAAFAVAERAQDGARGPRRRATADGVRRLASWAASEIEGVNGGADLAEGLGLLLRIDVQQVVAERRFAAFFTPAV